MSGYHSNERMFRVKPIRQQAPTGETCQSDCLACYSDKMVLPIYTKIGENIEDTDLGKVKKAWVNWMKNHRIVLNAKIRRLRMTAWPF